MSGTRTLQELTQKLKDIRHRALLYAEYSFYSRMIQSEERFCFLDKEEWESAVREVELHIMRQEDPSLVMYIPQNFKPLGVFFDEAYNEVIRIERA